MKATHKVFDAIVGLQVVHLMPGQFIFGLRVASKETGLTIREIRTILDFLRKAGNVTIKTTNKFSVISIVNWHIYQGNETENDTLNDKPLTNHWQHTRTIKHKKKRTPEKILSEISVLEERYSDPKIIEQAFQAISSTRKSNRIADSVKLSILQSWNKYPIESIMTGIRTYLGKGCAEQGKDEKYLLGIIRITDGQVMKSTGSHVLDEHYRSQGVKII
jgi:hypothetical protein